MEFTHIPVVRSESGSQCNHGWHKPCNVCEPYADMFSAHGHRLRLYHIPSSEYLSLLTTVLNAPTQNSRVSPLWEFAAVISPSCILGSIIPNAGTSRHSVTSRSPTKPGSIHFNHLSQLSLRITMLPSPPTPTLMVSVLMQRR